MLIAYKLTKSNNGLLPRPRPLFVPVCLRVLIFIMLSISFADAKCTYNFYKTFWKVLQSTIYYFTEQIDGEEMNIYNKSIKAVHLR